MRVERLWRVGTRLAPSASSYMNSKSWADRSDAESADHDAGREVSVWCVVPTWCQTTVTQQDPPGSTVSPFPRLYLLLGRLGAAQLGIEEDS